MKSQSFIVKHRRYLYHLSKTLCDKHIKLIPWNNPITRAENEPEGKRICVAPTIEQCITAIPYSPWDIFTVYRTKSQLIPSVSRGIFDSSITYEGWLETPTSFIKVGILRFQKVEKLIGKDVIEEAATENDIVWSKKVLKWWKKVKVKKFIEIA